MHTLANEIPMTLFPPDQRDWETYKEENECPNREWWVQTTPISFKKRTGNQYPRPSYLGDSERDGTLHKIHLMFNGELDADYDDETERWEYLPPKALVVLATSIVLGEDGYRECHYPECQPFQDRVRDALPKSRWPQWNESIVHFLGCYLAAESDGEARQNIALQIFMLTKRIFSLFEFRREIPKRDEKWLLGFLEVFGWMDQWADFVAPQTQSHYESITALLPQCLQQLMQMHWAPKLRQQLAHTHIPGVCPASVWNMAAAQQQYGGVLEVLKSLHTTMRQVQRNRPAITAPSQPSWPLRPHAGCRYDRCDYASMETEKVVQLHKCRTNDCPKVEISLDVLTQRFQKQGPWRCSAWDIRSWDCAAYSKGKRNQVLNTLLDDSRSVNYMAISHVWADGTGVGGGRKQGVVNSCLLNFWISVAQACGCDGLWWDAICLPQEPTARRHALNTMLPNYQKANKVLVYDDDFAHSPLISPSVPTSVLVGLVLSSWFTRGWTAAELSAADMDKIVTIKYSPERRGGPSILRLNMLLSPRHDREEYERFGFDHPDDVWIPNLAHLSAVNLLRQVTLRHLQFDDTFPLTLLTRQSSKRFESLIRTLRPRNTSWENDRMLIASLMWDVSDMSQQWNVERGTITNNQASQADLTKALLLKARVIPRWAPFHGRPTIAEEGNWSWCPETIFELGKALGSWTYPSEADSRDLLTITSDGVAAGWFYAVSLTAAGIKPRNVRPCDNDHFSPRSAKIFGALAQPENCALLLASRPEFDAFDQMAVALLVQTVRVERDIKLARYQYGDGSIFDTYDKTRPPSGQFREPELRVKSSASCRFVGCVSVTLSERAREPMKSVYCLLGLPETTPPVCTDAQYVIGEMPEREVQVYATPEPEPEQVVQRPPKEVHPRKRARHEPYATDYAVKRLEAPRPAPYTTNHAVKRPEAPVPAYPPSQPYTEPHSAADIRKRKMAHDQHSVRFVNPERRPSIFLTVSEPLTFGSPPDKTSLIEEEFARLFI